jgi:uncharacterized glyoxalase superfamily protein PhnB
VTDKTPAPTIWPCLSYSNQRAAIRFLVEVFGFDETLVVPGERDGEIVHVELRWPEGGGIMFGSGEGEGEFAVKPGNASLYVVTDAPDALFERATAAGAELVRGSRTRTTARAASLSATRRATSGASAPTAGPDERFHNVTRSAVQKVVHRVPW